jgi:hypothetical protein
MMLAAASRYCWGTGSYPDPSGQRSRLVAAVVALQAGTSHTQDDASSPVVIACSDATLPPLLEAGATAGLGPMCVPEAAAYHRLSDKWSLFQLARELGVPTPDTWLARAGSACAADIAAGSSAVAVKPRASVLEVGGIRRKLPVLLLPRGALPDLLAGDTYPAGAELLVQTLVPGDGVGVSALCAAGQAVRWFAHRRLREKPPSGGVSTLCESIALPAEVRDYCERLIAAVRWHGPVMFEFKWTPEGAWSLIEVNGRLWGSIQLCIDCGVDLPLAMYRLARGETVAADDRYIVGRRLRWLMGDLGYLYLVLRGRSVDPRHPSRGAALGNFLSARPSITAIEDWRYGDWRPFARQVAAEFGR